MSWWFRFRFQNKWRGAAYKHMLYRFNDLRNTAIVPTTLTGQSHALPDYVTALVPCSTGLRKRASPMLYRTTLTGQSHAVPDYANGSVPRFTDFATGSERRSNWFHFPFRFCFRFLSLFPRRSHRFYFWLSKVFSRFLDLVFLFRMFSRRVLYRFILFLSVSHLAVLFRSKFCSEKLARQYLSFPLSQNIVPIRALYVHTVDQVMKIPMEGTHLGEYHPSPPWCPIAGHPVGQSWREWRSKHREEQKCQEVCFQRCVLESDFSSFFHWISPDSSILMNTLCTMFH